MSQGGLGNGNSVSDVSSLPFGVRMAYTTFVVRTLRRDVTTDWVTRDDVRARIRSTIKRLLAKYGSPLPPDAEAYAIKRVLDQMETFADDWSPEP